MQDLLNKVGKAPDLVIKKYTDDSLNFSYTDSGIGEVEYFVNRDVENDRYIINNYLVARNADEVLELFDNEVRGAWKHMNKLGEPLENTHKE